MNKKVIYYLLNRICLGVCFAMLATALVGLWYKEAIWEWLAIIAVTFGASFVFRKYSLGTLPSDITVREGIGGVFFCWILACFIGAIPFVLYGILGPVPAFFESMSGLTTTGATVIDDIEALPKSLILWRSVLHWIGGIGIIVIFVALLPQIAGGAMHLFNAETSGFSNSRIMPRIRTTAMATFGIYFGFTAVLIALLMLCGMSFFDAVNHSFSTIATGGFSSYNDSVMHFNSAWIEYILGIFMIISGGNFSLYYQVYQSGFRQLYRDMEFRCYIIFTIVATLLITANICYVKEYSIIDGFRYSFFQTTSFISTTGFVSYDYDQWPSFSKLILACMYLTGGCAGSTAGGIKFGRFVVLIKAVGAEIERAMHPNALLTVTYEKKTVSTTTIINISRFFFMYITLIVGLAFILSWSGIPVEESIFGIASCISSVGPAFGSIGAVHNFSSINDVGLMVMSVAMLLGRLELFTALVLLRGEYWRSSKRW